MSAKAIGLIALRLMVVSLAAVVAATLRRLAYGPRLPGWSFTTELLCAARRAALDVLAQSEPAAARRIMELVPTLRVKDVREASGELGGVPALHFEATQAGEQPPCVLYFHGGGYVLGSPRTHAGLAAAIAQGTGGRVTSVDYRLAPAHPYPAALQDALAVYTALLASGVKPEQLVVGGDSAGGNLTVALLVALRDHGQPLPAGGVLICPWLDLANADDSFGRNAKTDTLSYAAAERWSVHFRAGRDARDPAVSPTHARLAGLPPLLILAGGAEVLLDQIEVFAARARAAGVDVEFEVTPEMFHDWMLSDAGPQSAQAFERISAFVRARTSS